MNTEATVTRIELAVRANTAPGSMWWSRLEAVPSPKGTTITNIVGEGWEDSPGEVMWVKTVTTSDCFRGLLSVLVADDAEGGIPAEVIDEVRVLGLDGWRADFAKFCWVRDDNFAPLGRDFVDFDDWHLVSIYREAGALSDLYKVRKKVKNPDFHKSFWQLNKDRDEIEALAHQKLPDVVQSFNLTGHLEFWDGLLLKVHNLAVRRNSQTEATAERRALELAPIRAYAERAHYQRIGGVLSGLGNALRRNGIIKYIEAHLKRTGEYPTGRHTVPYLSGISNNRLTSPSTLEVRFPDKQ